MCDVSKKATLNFLLKNVKQRANTKTKISLNPIIQLTSPNKTYDMILIVLDATNISEAFLSFKMNYFIYSMLKTRQVALSIHN